LSDLKEITLETLNGGSVPETFQHEWTKLLENIDDVNTPAKKARKITITVSVHPSEDRRTAAVSVVCEAKFAPPYAAETMVHLTKCGAKRVALGSDPRQLAMPMDRDDVRAVGEED